MNQAERAVAMNKDLEHYLRLRYPIELVEAEEGGYFARIPDLPGCMAQGETIDETLMSLEGAKSAWIEVRLEDGLDIPPPREVVDEYSGRFLLRVPKSLHRDLATRAREEGTSLNQYVLHLLSLGLGHQPGHAQTHAIEMLRDREAFFQQIFKSAMGLGWHQMGSTIHQACHSWNLIVDYPSREEAQHHIAFRNWTQVLWGQEEPQELRRKAEALYTAALTLKGHPAPKV